MSFVLAQVEPAAVFKLLSWLDLKMLEIFLQIPFIIVVFFFNRWPWNTQTFKTETNAEMCGESVRS